MDNRSIALAGFPTTWCDPRDLLLNEGCAAGRARPRAGTYVGSGREPAAMWIFSDSIGPWHYDLAKPLGERVDEVYGFCHLASTGIFGRFLWGFVRLCWEAA